MAGAMPVEARKNPKAVHARAEPIPNGAPAQQHDDDDGQEQRGGHGDDHGVIPSMG
ncbi:hypothetical protein STENM223S_00219 [Streptomyces tendae]